jgi:hypothetical protein
MNLDYFRLVMNIAGMAAQQLVRINAVAKELIPNMDNA